MLLLHTALMAEAKPLIRRYCLKAVEIKSGLRLYVSEETALVVSGVGRVRAGAAISFGIAYSRQELGVTPFVLNIGVCGSADPGRPEGRAYCVGKCTEVARMRAYYPDVLFVHNLEEADLHTFDAVIESREKALAAGSELSLVDMEAAGVFEAGSLFLPPSRVLSVKVVGDHLDNARTVTPEAVEAHLEAAIDAIAGFIGEYRRFAEDPEGGKPEVLAGEDENLLAEIRDALRLTRAQEDRLNNAARFARLSRSVSLTEAATPFLRQSPRHKRERAATYQKLLDGLHGK